MILKSLGSSAAALAITAALVSSPAEAESRMQGTFALPGAAEKVRGELTVRETGPLAREIVVAFTDKATGRPVTRYHEELTQELHVLATDSGLSSFVHEHAEKVRPDGRFQLQVRFPKPGLYHVYADASPAGIGQQVIRFDVPVDVPAASHAGAEQRPSVAPGAGLTGAALQGSDGPYTVKLDAAGISAGAEGVMRLTILKDGAPATDLSPYLGVPAHAVFIGAEDLAYVHAHATAADEVEAGHGGGHGGHGSHGATQPAVPAELVLHATPPRPGRYALWIQFMGDGQVRTVPFNLTVPAQS